MGRISKDDELIRRTTNGRFVLYKSNFDFLEKPKSEVEESAIKQVKKNKQSITQAFFKQKK